MPAFTHLASIDRAAVVEHLAALTPDELHLRFGTGTVDPRWIEAMADHLLRESGNFGQWDAQRRRLLILGCYASATDPAAAAFAISALPQARSAAATQTARWLLPQLVARGYQRVQVFFFASHEALKLLARRLDLSVSFIRGEGRVIIELPVPAQAMDHRLRCLDQLLEAARRCGAVSTGVGR